MVNVLVKPTHGIPPLVNVGVTTIVATTGVNPVFNAVKAGIGPDPLVGKPMLAFVFVQE